MLDGRVLGASQAEKNPFGKRQVSAFSKSKITAEGEKFMSIENPHQGALVRKVDVEML